ncbi:MAG: SPOR domain-containing protein [Bacteroidales bacterium]|nr:SPOR domain-containing protein [Bacteroidales bacterium]
MRYPVFIILMLLLSLTVVSQEKSINVITQPAWPPGSFVPVRVEIRNDGRHEFARFYQDLPQGFSVRSGETAGADFYWENNQVNFVWVKMPEDEIIRISYLAKADEVLKGSFKLGGTLNYVIDGATRKTVEFGPLIIRLDINAPVEENLEEFNREEAATVNIIPLDTVIKQELTQKVEFRVQVAISSEHLTKPELEKRIACPLKYGIKVLKTGNMYKYQSGTFPKYTEASSYLEDLKSKGVRDAFLVAYRGDEQISISLARTLTE